MDPLANIIEQRSLATKLLTEHSYEDPSTGFVDTDAHVGDAERLAELVIALDEWRTNGGFDPYADPNAPVVDPQANALLARVKANKSSRVFCPPGAGLPDDYVYVIEGGMHLGGVHQFECGIAPDGSVSS